MNDLEDLLSDEPPIPCAPGNLKEPIFEHIRNRLPDPHAVVKPLLLSYPTDPDVLILAALAALLEERPDQSLTYQKRLKRRYVPSPAVHLLHPLALAQKRRGRKPPGSWINTSSMNSGSHAGRTTCLAETCLGRGSGDGSN